MRKSLRTIALWTLLVAGSSFLFAGAAFADCEGMREFTGLVQGMKKGKKGGFVVDNRQGDKVKFIRDATSTVVDEVGGAKPKTEWDHLANGDYVSVCWKFTDNPRKAAKALTETGIEFTEATAEIVEVPNKPGALLAQLDRLAKKGVNLRSICATSGRNARSSVVVWTSH